MSSSQLTNSIIFGTGGSTTNQNTICHPLSLQSDGWSSQIHSLNVINVPGLHVNEPHLWLWWRCHAPKPSPKMSGESSNISGWATPIQPDVQFLFDFLVGSLPPWLAENQGDPKNVRYNNSF